MTVESVRRVTGRWPSTGNAVDPAGSSIPTLADIEHAFTAWITEARARGCPDTAPAGPVHLYGPDTYGLAVQWDAADDVTPAARCKWASEHARWERPRHQPGDHETLDGIHGTLVACDCGAGLLLDPDEEQPGPAPASVPAADQPVSHRAILAHLLTAVATGQLAAGVVPDIGPSITIPADADPDQPVTITLIQGADGPPYLTIRRASRDAAPTTPDAGSPPPAVVHARCDNPSCCDLAGTTVTLPELAPRVFGHPTLRCSTCGWHLSTIQGVALDRTRPTEGDQ